MINFKTLLWIKIGILNSPNIPSTTLKPRKYTWITWILCGVIINLVVHWFSYVTNVNNIKCLTRWTMRNKFSCTSAHNVDSLLPQCTQLWVFSFFCARCGLYKDFYCSIFNDWFIGCSLLLHVFYKIVNPFSSF